MELKNGYKLIYEAVRNGERHLYATKEATPSAEDVALTYGIDVETLKDAKLVYEKNGKMYMSETGIPSDDDEQLTIMCGTEEVLGDPNEEPNEDEEPEEEPEEQEPSDEPTTED